MVDELFAYFRNHWPQNVDDATGDATATGDAYQTPGEELAETGDEELAETGDEGVGEKGDVGLAEALGVPSEAIVRMTPTKSTPPTVPTRTSPSKVGSMSAEEAREKKIQDLKHFVQNWHCSEFFL